MSEEDTKALKAALQKQRSGGDQEVGLVQVGVALQPLIPSDCGPHIWADQRILACCSSL